MHWVYGIYLFESYPWNWKPEPPRIQTSVFQVQKQVSSFFLLQAAMREGPLEFGAFPEAVEAAYEAYYELLLASVGNWRLWFP